MQLTPPGTPLPQEMIGALTVETVESSANDGTSARATRKQTARMDNAHRIGSILPCRPPSVDSY